MKRWWRSIALVSVAVLSACSSLDTQRASDNADAVEISKQLHRVGRFAVLVYDKTEERNKDSVQGNFDWSSVGKQITLDLSSPLGQVLARVEVHPGLSRLTRANGEVFEASNPDVLIQEVIGRTFPVSGLRYWIYGRPIPGLSLESAEYDEQQRLTKFSQAGWNVVAQNYDQQGPRRFQLTNNQATERINIRIVME